MRGRKPIYPFRGLSPGDEERISMRRGETQATFRKRVRDALGQHARRHGGNWSLYFIGRRGAIVRRFN